MRVRRVVSFLTLLVALTSCQSYVAVPVQPATLVSVAQHSQVKVATKADILFVVDDSLSMSGKQDRLAQALAGFTAALDALRPPIDYQVAVVTTSIFERFGACGPDGDPNAAAQCDSDWGAPGYVCKAAACVRTFDEAGQLRLAPGNPATVLVRSSTDAARFSSWVANDVEAGSAGARQPQAFDAMKIVLSDPAAGFVRDGSKIVVAFVSDAEDCSDPHQRFSMLVKDANGNVIDQCAQQSASDGSTAVSLEPAATYVNFLRSLANSDGSAKEVEVAAIVSLADGTHEPGLCTDSACVARCDAPAAQQACRTRCANAVPIDLCVADCTAECKNFCNGQVPSRRLVEMATAFQGLTANVCSDDASDTMGRLAAVIGIPKQIELLAPPAALEYLRVHVDRGSAGLDCTFGQGFDLVNTVDGPAVRFLGNCVLQPNDIWDIRYLANR
jgi:hypothetical protein